MSAEERKTTRKTTTVNIRVDAERKARWAEAAGGERRLSAWMRELADAASSPDAIIEGLTDAQPLARVAELVDAAASSTAAERREGSTPSPSIEQESSAGQCPRWMHHRKGVYCGTCKKVN